MKKITLALAFILLASSFGLSALARSKRAFPLGEFDVAPGAVEIYQQGMITTGRFIIEPERNKDWNGHLEIRDLDGEVLCSGPLNGGQFKICPLVRGEYEVTIRNNADSKANAGGRFLLRR